MKCCRKSAITPMRKDYKEQQVLLEWIWRGSFLKWDLLAPAGMQIILVGKYARDGSVSPQSPTALHCEKSRSANVFKKMRDKAYDETYQTMRKEWRASE